MIPLHPVAADNPNMRTPLSSQGGQLVAPLDDSDHVLGPPTAPVTLLEYGDYQCPFCGAAHPIVIELLRHRPDTVRYAFRHFPMTNVHPIAESAAEVAEAAGARERFWQVHDWLFTHQDNLDPDSLRAELRELDLDADAIIEEERSHRYQGKVRNDFVSGVHSGVNGTPTFFVNGMRHDGGFTMPELMAAVDHAAEDVT